MNLKEMIDDNMAVLEAESNHKEMLAKEKLQRQREALIELREEIKPVIEEAGYSIGLRRDGNIFAKKWRAYEDSWERSVEKVYFLKVEFEDSRHLKNTGESESFYAPDKGLYHIMPNVAFDHNKEVEGLDPLTYKELTGTKDMVIERLAVVLANAMRYEQSEANRIVQKWEEKNS